MVPIGANVDRFDFCWLQSMMNNSIRWVPMLIGKDKQKYQVAFGSMYVVECASAACVAGQTKKQQSIAIFM